MPPGRIRRTGRTKSNNEQRHATDLLLVLILFLFLVAASRINFAHIRFRASMVTHDARLRRAAPS
jgi:hypothetical protein